MGFNGAAPARARNGLPFGAGPVPAGLLQRGRARAGAEWELPGVQDWLERVASTGPRPRGRGMNATRKTLSLAGSGFNGAAPARARNVRRVSNVRPLSRSFNGAAPARARNADKRRRSPRPARCFNGAAPARARNEGHGLAGVEVGHASTGPRPRGRGMAGTGSRPRLSLTASTGPRPRGRGMWRRGPGPWGLRCCFNGAAPARARNV